MKHILIYKNKITKISITPHSQEEFSNLTYIGEGVGIAVRIDKRHEIQVNSVQDSIDIVSDELVYDVRDSGR